MKTESLKQLQRDITIANNQREIDRILKVVLNEVSTVKEIFKENQVEIKRIKALPPGKKGDKGDPGKDAKGIDGKDGKQGPAGYTPVRGKDYWTARDIEQLIVAVMSRIRTPKDGEDAIFDKDSLLEEVLTKIKEEVDKRYSTKEEVASYRNQLAGKHYGKDTWARGGGDTVVAGTNITITTNNDGNKVISATGGAGLSILSPVGAVDSSNVTFVFTDDPVVIVRDGSTLREGFGYSYNSGTNTATLDIPPSFDLYGLK